ncbi:hypothetical protein ACPCJU_01470 [Streptomyces thermodiastaticus]
MNTERPDHDDAARAAQAAGEDSARPEETTPAGTSRASEDKGEEKTVGGGDAGTGAGAGASGGRRGRFGRGRSPVVVASVAAAVLLVGGGGAYLATGASGGAGDGRAAAAASGGAHGTPAALVLDGVAAGGGSGGHEQGIAPGEPNPYGTVYRAAGPLPDGPGSAAVQVARGEVSREQVARLARALGVAGAPVADADAWRVGAGKDGTGPVLRVERQAPGAWTFSRYAPGTDDCKGVRCVHDPAAPAGDPVSEEAAKKAAAPVLEALGQSDAVVDAGQVMGAQRIVDAEPRIGGLPTYGWTTSLTVGVGGEVVGGSGQLATPVKADTYPVLSAQRTLELLNGSAGDGHRMGIGGCTRPVPLKDRLEQPCDAVASPAAAGRGSATVDSAEFGLSAQASQGRPVLVPSWLFRVRGTQGQEGFTVAYPAVDPRYVRSADTASGAAGARPGGDGTVTQDVRVTGYRAEGNALTLYFEGGVCADYAASAQESSDRVTVTVTQTAQRDRVCILVARQYERTVHLDRPLDGRTVTGSDGRPIPQSTGAGPLPSSEPVR